MATRNDHTRHRSLRVVVLDPHDINNAGLKLASYSCEFILNRVMVGISLYIHLPDGEVNVFWFARVVAGREFQLYVHWKL